MLSVVTVLAKPRPFGCAQGRPRGWPPASPRAVSHLTCFACTQHVKVQGNKNPHNGGLVYWGARLGRDPTKSPRVLRLLREQRGRCGRCGLRLTTEGVLEVHHKDGHHNNNAAPNLVLLHAPCHDQEHGTRCQ